MSINDLLDSTMLIPVLAVFGVAFFIGIPFLISRTEKEVYGNSKDIYEEEKAAATVVEKRTENNYLTQSIKVNIVVFELENGKRIDLAVRDASVIVVGDKGVLSYSGKRFISFVRDGVNDK